MAKGRVFFKNVAILMAIFPIYNIAYGLFNGNGPFAGLVQISDISASSGILRIGVITAIIGAVVSIFVGIIGMKNADKPEKMGKCIFLGVIVMLIYAASQIIDFAGGGVHDTMDYIGMVGGFAIPACFIVGAVQTKAGE